MKINKAIEALNKGLRVRRQSWPEENKFIFKQIPSEISLSIIPVMQSLPESVKQYFIKELEKRDLQSIHYDNQIALVKSINMITAYSLSVEDLLEEDWIILE